MLKIRQCVMCGCDQVESKELEVPVNTIGIVSVKVNGAKCVNCGEEYYDGKDLLAIEQMEKSRNETSVSA